jgi:hypothetical protein
MADKIERNLSLNKAVQEEKIPELLKIKTSMQQSLEQEIGGLGKIREYKQQEWDRPQITHKVQTESGEEIDILSPAVPADSVAQKMELFRARSFAELYELEKPYEGKPKSRAGSTKVPALTKNISQPEEESKD